MTWLPASSTLLRFVASILRWLLRHFIQFSKARALSCQYNLTLPPQKTGAHPRKPVVKTCNLLTRLMPFYGIGVCRISKTVLNRCCCSCSIQPSNHHANNTIRWATRLDSRGLQLIILRGSRRPPIHRIAGGLVCKYVAHLHRHHWSAPLKSK